MHNMNSMSIYETGKADYQKRSDIELCTMIDSLARNKYGKESVYQLSMPEKVALAEYLYRLYHPSDSQMRRCMILV